MVHANLKKQIPRDICKNRRFTIWRNFIELTRALSSKICQAAAFRSHLKQFRIRLNKSGWKWKMIISYVLLDCEIAKNWFCQEDWIFVSPTSRNIDSVPIFSDFELLFLQLLKLSLVSQQNLSYLKTCLTDLANRLINTMVNSSGFLRQKNHFEVAKCLKLNSDILLTRPDKGAGIVILNRTDYITKMATILDDTTQFLKIGDLSFDDTHRLEFKLQMWFL